MIKYYNGLRCYDSCLVYILEQENCIASKYFFDTYQTPWEKGNLLGEKLKFNYNIKAHLTKFKGMSSNFVDDVDTFNYGEHQYYIFEIDTYYYPIHRLYQKEHTNHFCFFYEKTNNKYGLIDPMMSSNIVYVERNVFEKSLISIEMLKFQTDDLLTNSNLIMELKSKYLTKNNENFFEALYEFSERIDLQKEYEGLKEKKYEVPLYRSLWELMNSRGLYSLCLKENLYTSSNLTDMLLELSNYWQEFRGRLAKLYFSNQCKIDADTLDFLKKIIEKEVITEHENIRYIKSL